MTALLRYLLMALIGLAGGALFFLGVHLWQDHESLHALVQIEMARQRAVAPAPAAPVK